MEASAVYLDAQHLFEPNVGQSNHRAEVVDKSELTRFVWCLERGDFESKLPCDSVCKLAVQLSVVVEHADPACNLASFDDNLQGTGIEPLVSASETGVE